MFWTQAELREHQQDAEESHVATFAVHIPDGKDTVGGFSVPKFRAGTQTKGRSGSGSSVGRDAVTRIQDVGGVPTVVVQGGLAIPVAAEMPSVGWEYECTASATDPGEVGRRWRVVNVGTGTWIVERRLDVTEVDPPQGGTE